jgi:protein phosphatase methylesterase 1
VKYSLPSQLVEKPNGNGQSIYVWRTDLAGSERHWNGWFDGLSERFLTMPNGRLLILAGTERLDKALTIGQMQGMHSWLYS